MAYVALAAFIALWTLGWICHFWRVYPYSYAHYLWAQHKGDAFKNVNYTWIPMTYQEWQQQRVDEDYKARMVEVQEKFVEEAKKDDGPRNPDPLSGQF